MKKIILIPLIILSAKINAQQVEYWTDYFYYNNNVNTANEICILENLNYGQIEKININNETIECNYNNTEEKNKVIKEVKKIEKNTNNIDILIIKDNTIKEVKTEFIEKALTKSKIDFIEYKIIEELTLDFKDIAINNNVAAKVAAKKLYKNNILNIDVVMVIGKGGDRASAEKIIIGQVQKHPLYMSTFKIEDNILNAHEFGHILGLSHDKDTLKYLPKNGGLDNTHYSQGFKFKKLPYIDYSVMSYSKNTICTEIKNSDSVFCEDAESELSGLNLIYTNDAECKLVMNVLSNYNPCGGFYKGSVNQYGYYDELNIYKNEENEEVYGLSDNKRVLIQTTPLVSSIGTRDYNDPLFIDARDIQFKDEKLDFHGSKFLLGTYLNDNISLTGNNDIIVTSGTGIITDSFDNIDLLEGDDIIVVDNFEKNGKTIIKNFSFNDKVVLNSNNFNITENSNEINIIGEGTIFIDDKKQIIENGFNVKIMKNFNLNNREKFNYDNYEKEKQVQVKEDIENCLKYLTKEECLTSEIKKIDFNSDIINDIRLQKVSKNKMAFKYENRINTKVKRGVRGDGFRNYIVANDTGQNLSGEGGQDFMFGGKGDDTLSNSDNNNPNKLGTYFKGGKGNDRLFGTSYGDTYIYDKGDGVDTIYEKFILKTDNMSDTLIINGYTYEELQITKNNKDIIIKMSESDTITIINGLQKDLQNRSHEIEIVKINGNNMTWEDFIAPALILRGTAGNDFISPNVKYYDFKILGGSGNDTLSADEGSNQFGKIYSIDGGEGNDNISVLYSNSITNYQITGGTGNNTISGSPNKDIIFIQGIDTILNTKGDDEHYVSDKIYSNINNLEDLITRNGNDIILKNGNNIIVTFKDYLNISIMNLSINPKLIYGTSNIEFNQIKSSQYRNLLNSYSIMNGNYLDRKQMIEHALNFKGTVSNDVYYGHQDFNNKYTGNKGNDSLNGTKNKDIYYFKSGDGRDFVNETTSNNNIIDEAIFENYGNYKISVQFRTNNIIISNGIDSVTFRDYLYKENGIYPYAIEKIVINQTEYNIQDIINILKIFNGTESNDLHKSISHTDNILYGNGNSDELIGGDQIEYVDTIYGGKGRDKLVGCGGQNYLYGEEDDDELFVFALYCMSNLESKTTMEGGKGNDSYNGSIYSETYIVNENDGFDSINENSSPLDSNKNDTLIINYINPIISRTQNNKDLTIVNRSKTSGVTIKNYFQKDINGKYTYAVENLIGLPYKDVLDVIKALTNYNGTQDNDIHYGFEGYDNIMYGFSGNDTLIGNNEFNYKDTIYGGSGDDILDGEGGTNFLYGEEGNDRLKAAKSEIESFTTMEGGKGNDIYEGSKFTEIYVINEGDGHDIIYKGVLPSDKNDYKNDTLIINYINPIIKRDWSTDDIIIESSDKKSSVKLVNYLKRDDQGRFLYAIENIEGIQQKNILDIINNITTFVGTNLPDTYKSFDGYDNILLGNEGKDTLIGSDELSFKDTIYGGRDDDVLVGCSGNNFLYGEHGNDILQVFSDKCLSVKNEGLTIMEGGAGNDNYFGSKNKEIINYESGIDSLNFKDLGAEDELNCRSGYYVKKYTTSIVLYYNQYDQIIINYTNDVNFSIKNICGKTINQILSEAVN